MGEQMMPQKGYIRKRDFTVLNAVGVCAETKSDCIREIMALPTSPCSANVVMIGVPMAVAAREHPEYAELFNNAAYAAIDGMPIVKIGRKKGFPCDRCGARDIMADIFAESLKEGKTHYLYGGKNDEVLQKLRDNLERDYPGVQIVGMYSPPFRPLTEEEDKQICEEINRLHPDFLWVGIGAPKQEMWMQEHREKIKGTVMLGVGAGFDFMAGTLANAPKWMEEASLEWLFRLIKEPNRLWKRYIIGGFKWVYYLIKDAESTRPGENKQEADR